MAYINNKTNTRHIPEGVHRATLINAVERHRQTVSSISSCCSIFLVTTTLLLYLLR